MGNLQGISLVMVFITVFTVFAFASNQVFPDYTAVNGSFNTSYDQPEESDSNWWDVFNPFTYIGYFYDIMTFEIFGLPPDLQKLVQMCVYVPLAAITVLCVLYYVRGN